MEMPAMNSNLNNDVVTTGLGDANATSTTVLSINSKHTHNESIFSRLNTAYKRMKISVFELYENNILMEDVKVFAPAWRYPVATILYVIFISLFVAFYYTGVHSNINQSSLIYSPILEGSDQFIPLGDYLISSNGYWEGSKLFSYGNAIYSVTLSNFVSDNDLFHTVITLIENSIADMTEKYSHYNLGYAALAWISYSQVQKESLGVSNRFTLNGSPYVLLNRQKQMTTISSNNGICDAKITTTYDSSTGQFVIAFSYTEFYSKPSCAKALGMNTIANMGYYNVTDGDVVSIPIDSASVMTCVSVNLEITFPYNLVDVQQLSGNGVNFYVDPKFPQMDPVLCLSLPITDRYNTACGITVGNVLLLPVFNHMGMFVNATEEENNIPSNQYCQCNATNYQFDQCNWFQFFSGFIFYETMSTSSEPLLYLYEKYNFTYDYINRGSFNTSYASFFSTDVSVVNDTLTFCELEGSYGGCTMISIGSFDVINREALKAITTNYHQLTNASCSDSFYMGNNAWNNVRAYPPAPLYNEYLTCKANATTVIVEQAGIASGNTGLLLPIGGTFLLFLLYVYQLFTGTTIPAGFSKKEKDDALQVLAKSMLLLKHNLLSEHDMEHVATIRNLLKEMHFVDDVDEFAARKIAAEREDFEESRDSSLNRIGSKINNPLQKHI